MKNSPIYLLLVVLSWTGTGNAVDDELSKAVEAWSGKWDSSYGVMELSFSKDGRFKGHYGPSKHALRGQLDKVNPKILTGSWKHTGSTSNGLIRFVLADDLKSFKGSYTSGESRPNPKSVNWTGTKSVFTKPRFRDWKTGEKPKWAGTWATTYGDLILKDKGDGRFEGTYGPAKHSVSATIDPKKPRVLNGTWKHANSDWTGRLTFKLTLPDRFEGHWTSAEQEPSTTSVNWEGVRSPYKLPLRLRGGER